MKRRSNRDVSWIDVLLRISEDKEMFSEFIAEVDEMMRREMEKKKAKKAEIEKEISNEYETEEE